MISLAWIKMRVSVCFFELGDGIGVFTDSDGLRYDRPAGFITVSEPAGPGNPDVWRLEWRLHDIDGPTDKLARWVGSSTARDLRWRLAPPEYVINEQP